MPYITCPECGASGHLNVANIESWYLSRWPDFKVGDVVPELCPKCWMTIKEYDSVMIVDLPNITNGIANGDIGVVVHVCGSDEYQVEGVGGKGDCKWLEVIHKKNLNKLSPKMRLTSR